MSSPFVALALAAAGCQQSPPPPKRVPAIEVKDATGAVTSRVVHGRPCRATVDGVELLVGRPLVAQVGSDRWTGEDAANGTTLKLNDRPVARIHAKQLFDAEGIPLVRVLDTGDVVDKSNAVVRKAVAGKDAVTIGDVTVTGTTDLVLAVMLTAREAPAPVRGLAACHFLAPNGARLAN